LPRLRLGIDGRTAACAYIDVVLEGFVKNLLKLVFCLVLCSSPLFAPSYLTAEPESSPGATGVRIAATEPAPSPKVTLPEEPTLARSEAVNAVIYPVQSATVGTEVRGVIDFMKYKEGEAVKEGAVVAEISRARYEAIVGEFKGNYDSVIRSLDRAKDELAIQEELYEKRATTYDDVSKARSQVQVLEARKEEADFKLKQAEINLKACIIKAPFSGSISVLYHEPYETVDNLEKLFGIVNTEQVYARVNWPETRLSEVAVGKKAAFVYEGMEYQGVIDKISNLIAPASKTKRVHILIDNPQGRLEIGMSGAVNLIGKKSASSKAEQ